MAERDLSGMKLLAVEDNPISQGVLDRTLAQIGIAAVRQATDGAAAIEAMAGFAPDVLLVDIRMEPMNGLELVRRVRIGETPVDRNTGVVFLTGASDEAIVSRALALDPDAFIVKPTTRLVLHDRLARCLGERPALRPVAAYRDIVTDLAVLTRLAEPPATVPDDADAVRRDDRSRTPKRVPVAAVPPGAELARAVLTRNNLMLLPAGAVLTGAYLKSLGDLDAVTGVADVWIWA